jgi:hypothetical protein
LDISNISLGLADHLALDKTERAELRQAIADWIADDRAINSSDA